jgi:hypothetical protein
MSADNIITVDIMHDDSAWIGKLLLTPPTKFCQKAVATALSGLGLPPSSSIAFRRHGRVVRTVSLEYAVRGKAA